MVPSRTDITDLVDDGAGPNLDEEYGDREVPWSEPADAMRAAEKTFKDADPRNEYRPWMMERVTSRGDRRGELEAQVNADDEFDPIEWSGSPSGISLRDLR